MSGDASDRFGAGGERAPSGGGLSGGGPGGSVQAAAHPSPASDPDGWRRLAGRMVAVHGVRLAGSLVPLVFVLVIGGGDLNVQVAIALAVIFGGAGVRAALDLVSWATTRYRVTAERVEVRSGLLRRSELSIPRDRIRTVNVTAKPLHRLFGLTTVEVGTGRAGQARLRLDAVPAPEGARLRAELLSGAMTTPPAQAAAAPTTRAVAEPADAAARSAGSAAGGATAGGAAADGASAGDATAGGAATDGASAGDATAGAATAGDATADGMSAGGTWTGGASVGGGWANDLPAGGAVVGEAPLATIRWRWLPYHLLSPWTLALPVIVLGAGIQALDAFGGEGFIRDAATDGLDRADDLPLLLTVTVLLLVAIVVGVVAATAVFVESWWGFRLTREPGGTLHVRRGLLTARSITIEQRRLRGVELAQPLPLRAADGASLLAIVSGLKGSDDGKSARVDALLPAAPRTDAQQVAAAVLRAPGAATPPADRPPARNAPAPFADSPPAPTAPPPFADRRPDRSGSTPLPDHPAAPTAPTPFADRRPDRSGSTPLPDRPPTRTAPTPRAEPADRSGPTPSAPPADTEVPGLFADLAPHPRAALRRRLVRAAGATVGLAAALAAAGPLLLDLLPGWAPLVGVPAAVPALLLGRDAYRSLGHRVAGDHLVTRHGTFVRRTYALERDGVIGWTVSRSPFQRRAGLATLTATTAAGSGGYRVVDVGSEEAVAFAEEAVPGLLAPFLVQRPDDASRHGAAPERSSATSSAAAR
ncbi:putative membrane protein [Conexibacter arvalis]|uniref:Putative membrane protein n=1 Tax=Conexibacter arvalis TaxID=912552 RepID=A0A840IIF3_9ACTN|nr:putative membrane protein [Conexibacter arvalis]